MYSAICFLLDYRQWWILYENLNHKCNYFSAAWQKVPQVSAISSTRIAILSLTSPTRTMVATSLAFFLSLWIRAKSTFSLSAMEVTLNRKITIIFKQFYQTLSNETLHHSFSLSLCNWYTYYSPYLNQNTLGMIWLFQHVVFQTLPFGSSSIRGDNAAIPPIWDSVLDPF